ncbi:hypothetical protein CF392_06325 [Tamilnaduibacter salinus]|uniref:LPS-assembly lipoprotein LptE n=1 Tax=Tamilnaduibacter salinus TaxID=1484056 RepID=A0A2A2I5F4_9GAMM|nr:LPS assembly lipoprotein LptE [Tamilnaduibacter salinus]PAV26350.1 hypothetical protein CF392_06325 [Tamilnaduibacter salinus]
MPLFRALVLLASALLAGCGFQLRGAAPVPAAVQPLSVTCADSVPNALCDGVRSQLRDGGVELEAPGNRAHRLFLGSFRERRRASAITLDAATAEYDLRQDVTLQLTAPDDVPLIASADIEASEIYRYDDTNVLAKQREEEAIRTSLYQRLAQQVIFRLAPMTEDRVRAIRRQQATGEPSRDDQTP